MQPAHLHVYCRELDPALVFMTKGLKGELIGKRLMMGCPGAEIRLGTLVVFLKEVGPTWTDADVAATTCGYNHLGFLVEDLDKTLAELTAIPGVRIETEPFVIPARKRRCAFVTGPSNLYVEFMEDVK